jgi:hypothetical protein
MGRGTLKTKKKGEAWSSAIYILGGLLILLKGLISSVFQPEEGGAGRQDR